MIKYGFIKNGICYIDGHEDVVVKHPFANGVLRTICTSCYKSVNPVEEIEPKTKRGKKYGGQTPIEKEYNDMFFATIDENLQNIIAHEKGSGKVCLIKDKWKWVNQK